MSCFKESFACAHHPATVRSALIVSLVVGTLLSIVNHYDEWLAGVISTTNTFQIIFTYLVPYLVSTHGQVTGSRNR